MLIVQYSKHCDLDRKKIINSVINKYNNLTEHSSNIEQLLTDLHDELKERLLPIYETCSSGNIKYNGHFIYNIKFNQLISDLKLIEYKKKIKIKTLYEIFTSKDLIKLIEDYVGTFEIRYLMTILGHFTMRIIKNVIYSNNNYLLELRNELFCYTKDYIGYTIVLKNNLEFLLLHWNICEYATFDHYEYGIRNMIGHDTNLTYNHIYCKGQTIKEFIKNLKAFSINKINYNNKYCTFMKWDSMRINEMLRKYIPYPTMSSGEMNNNLNDCINDFKNIIQPKINYVVIITQEKIGFYYPIGIVIIKEEMLDRLIEIVDEISEIKNIHNLNKRNRRQYEKIDI